MAGCLVEGLGLLGEVGRAERRVEARGQLAGALIVAGQVCLPPQLVDAIAGSRGLEDLRPGGVDRYSLTGSQSVVQDLGQQWMPQPAHVGALGDDDSVVGCFSQRGRHARGADAVVCRHRCQVLDAGRSAGHSE